MQKIWAIIYQPIIEEEIGESRETKKIEIQIERPDTEKIKQIIDKHFWKWNLDSWWIPEEKAEF